MGADSERPRTKCRGSQLMGAMDVLAAAIYTTDSDGFLTYFNPAAVALAGRVPQLGVDRWCITTKVFLPDGTLLPTDQCQMAVALKEGKIMNGMETIVERPDGSRIWVTPYPHVQRDDQNRIIGGVNMLLDITERKQLQQIAQENELSARILQLQDEERRRVARELHDGVGQLLAAMAMNTSRVAREKTTLSMVAAKCVDENLTLIEDALNEVRTVSYLLHPPLLEEMGLESALKWYISGFAERSKISAKLQLHQDLGRLPRAYELCLFRIAQECLTNVHRHSGSLAATVKISRNSKGVTLKVQDEGRGVTRRTQAMIVAGQTQGVGLRGMRERLRHLGGSLKIASNRKGTTVIAILPSPELVALLPSNKDNKVEVRQAAS